MLAFRLPATRIIRLVPSAALLVAVVAGCATPAAYRDPITRFQQASTVVTEVARLEYRDANRRERNAEIDRRAERRQRIDLSVLSSADLRLIDEQGMEARLAALDALSKHGALLLALASSDAPTRAQEAAKSLDDAVIKLSSALGASPSDDFKARAGAFAEIAGLVTKLVLEHKITQAMDQGIVASKDAVPGLISALREDMADLHARKRAILSARRVRATDDYNDQLAKTPVSQSALLKAAEGIKDVEDEWDRLPSMLGSGAAFDAMAAAQANLVAYAESPKKPQDLANLVEATDAFASSAKVIADSIKIIRDGA